MAQEIGEADAGARQVADGGTAIAVAVARDDAQVVIARTGVMLGRQVGAQQQAEAVVGLPFQGQVGGNLVAAHGRLVVAIAGGRIVVEVGDIAPAIADLPGSAEGQRVGERDVDRALDFGAAVIAGRGLDIAAIGAIGLARGIQDRAAGGIAAHQGALRAFQHGDAVNVEQSGGQTHRTGHINAVHVDRRGGIEGHHRLARAGIEIALATDGDVQRVLPEGGGRNIDRRRAVAQVFDGPDVQPVQVGLVIGGDGNRHHLLVFGALAGGDDDRLQPGHLGMRAVGGLRLGGQGKIKSQRGGGQQTHNQTFQHRNPLRQYCRYDFGVGGAFASP